VFYWAVCGSIGLIAINESRCYCCDTRRYPECLSIDCWSLCVVTRPLHIQRAAKTRTFQFRFSHHVRHTRVYKFNVTYRHDHTFNYQRLRGLRQQKSKKKLVVSIFRQTAGNF